MGSPEVMMGESQEVGLLNREQQQLFSASMEAIQAGRFNNEVLKKIRREKILPQEALDGISDEYIKASERKIEEQKTENDRLKEESITDPLTRLVNRREMDRVARSIFNRLTHPNTVPEGKPDNRRLAVLFIDIDEMKAINDGISHDAGDKAIACAASIIKEQSRATDVTARFGGDEMVIFFEYDAEEADIEKIAERYAHELSILEFEAINDNKQLVKVKASASVGCHSYSPKELLQYAGINEETDESGNDPIVASLISAADNKMYSAKRAKKNDKKNGEESIEYMI